MSEFKEALVTDAPPPAATNLLEQAWDGFNTTFKGSLSGVATSAADTIASSTKDTPFEVSSSTVKGVLPYASAAAVAVSGAALLDPLTKVGNFIGRAIRNVVTGFGLFEKIPLIGGLFTSLGKGVDTISEYLGIAFTALASLIAFKALQVEPKPLPKGRNLDDDKHEQAASGAPQVILPGTQTEMKRMTPEEKIEAAKKAAEKLTAEMERTPTAEDKVVTKEMLEKLKKEVGGEKEFEKLHEDLFGKKNSGDSVDPKLTEARAAAMEEFIRTKIEAASANEAVARTSSFAARAIRRLVRWGIPGAAVFIDRGVTPKQALTEAVKNAEISRPAVVDHAVDKAKTGLSTEPSVAQPSEPAAPKTEVTIKPGTVKSFMGTEVNFGRATNLGFSLPIIWLGSKEAWETLVNNKYKGPKAGDVYGFNKQDDTYKQVTEMPSGFQKSPWTSWLPQGRSYQKINLADETVIESGTDLVLDPEKKIYGATQATAVAGASGVVSGELKQALYKSLGKAGSEEAGAVLKEVGGKALIYAVIANDVVDVTQLVIDGKGEEAAKKGIKDAGELVIMYTLPAGTGVAVVVVAHTLEEVDAVCEQVKDQFPTAKRTFFLTDKEGKRVQLTEDNAYKTMKHFSTALDMAATNQVKTSAGISQEEWTRKRDVKIAEFKKDPFQAWKEIYTKAKSAYGKPFVFQGNTQAERDADAARLLKEFAAGERQDFKPNAAVTLARALVASEGDDVGFGEAVTNAELSVIAKEIRMYANMVGATPDNPLGDISAIGHNAKKGTHALTKDLAKTPASMPLPAGTPKLDEVAQKNNQLMLTAGWAALKEAKINRGIMKGIVQHHEDTVVFVKEARTMLTEGSTEQNEFKTKRDSVIDVTARTYKLNPKQANGLFPLPPKLRVTIFPGPDGKDTDGTDITKVAERFSQLYQEQYGVGQIRVNGEGGNLMPLPLSDPKLSKYITGSQRIAYFSKALAEYEAKMDEYNGKRSKFFATEGFSYNYYDTSKDCNGENGRDVLTWLVCSTPVEGKVQTAKGELSRKDELKFLEDTITAEMTKVTGYNFGKPVIKANGDVSEEEQDRKREFLRKYLRNVQKSLEENQAKFVASYRQEEEMGGKIFNYVQQMQFADASLKLADTFKLMLLSSDRTNEGKDTTNANPPKHAGSWVAFKDMVNGTLYYAEGKWTKSGNKDVFIVSEIVSQTTGEHTAPSKPLALDMSDITGSTSINLPDEIIPGRTQQWDAQAKRLRDAIDSLRNQTSHTPAKPDITRDNDQAITKEAALKELTAKITKTHFAQITGFHSDTETLMHPLFDSKELDSVFSLNRKPILLNTRSCIDGRPTPPAPDPNIARRTNLQTITRMYDNALADSNNSHCYVQLLTSLAEVKELCELAQKAGIEMKMVRDDFDHEAPVCNVLLDMKTADVRHLIPAATFDQQACPAISELQQEIPYKSPYDLNFHPFDDKDTKTLLEGFKKDLSGKDAATKYKDDSKDLEELSKFLMTLPAPTKGATKKVP